MATKLNGGVKLIADRLTTMEVAEANVRHTLDKAAVDDATLIEKLKVLEDELQRWTAASAEQAAALAAMQEVTDSAFSRSVTLVSAGDGT